MASWPATCKVEIELFTRLTPEDRLVPVFAGVDVPLVICGHTHMQFDRTIGRMRVVNAGSVGMPFSQPQGAYWLLLGPEIQLRRTAYDFRTAAERIRNTDYPLAEELSVRYVLNPPTEAETLELYAQAELR